MRRLSSGCMPVRPRLIPSGIIPRMTSMPSHSRNDVVLVRHTSALSIRSSVLSTQANASFRSSSKVIFLSLKLPAFDPVKQVACLLVELEDLHDRTDCRLGVKIGEAHARVVTNATALNHRKTIGSKICDCFLVIRHDKTQMMESFITLVQKLLIDATTREVLDQLNL